MCIYCRAQVLKRNKGILERLWLNDDLSATILWSYRGIHNKWMGVKMKSLVLIKNKIGWTLHRVALKMGKVIWWLVNYVTPQPTEPTRNSQLSWWALKNTIKLHPWWQGRGHLWYPTDVHWNGATSRTPPPSELWDILMGQSLVYISEGAREEHHYEGLFFPLGAFAGVLIWYWSCLKNLHHNAVTSEMN